MFEFLQDIGNYEERKVGKDKVGVFEVSTAYTTDEGYETAIIDKNKSPYPVERYSNKEKAEEGHKKWTEKMKKPPKELVYLGGWGIIKDNKLILSEDKKMYKELER